jgi:class 3 adenylate cyclase
MTKEDERPEVVRNLVVVFDTCSSTAILEDLKRTDNLPAWRNLLIGLKQYLFDARADLGMELYKFVGDGWILLLPDRIDKQKLCDFLSGLSKWFDATFDAEISGLLEHHPDPIGLTFGIDSGELIRLEMNDQQEYIGRAINVAARLQGQAKEVPGGPAYKALFSKSSFNSVPRPPARIKVEPLTVPLRNISMGERYECLVFTAYQGKHAGGQHPKRAVQSPKKNDIRNHLAQLLNEGKDIQHHFEYSNFNAPREKEEWESRVDAYLKKDLDGSYAVRFRAPTQQINSFPDYMDPKWRVQWADTTAKMARLNEFIAELGAIHA